MRAEQRKHGRRQLELPTWVENGGHLIEYRLVNISIKGARLELCRHTEALPNDQFILYLTVDRKVKRYCQVAWKGSNSIGVRFVDKSEWDAPQCIPHPNVTQAAILEA